jgi:hypothetical protein
MKRALAPVRVETTPLSELRGGQARKRSQQVVQAL